MEQNRVVYVKTPITDEELSRVKKVNVPYRMFMQWCWDQKELPYYAVFPTLNLPEGYVLLRAMLSMGGMCVEFIVYHASFDLVADGHDIPRIDEKESILWNAYMLCTEEELAARRKGVTATDLETWTKWLSAALDSPVSVLYENGRWRVFVLYRSTVGSQMTMVPGAMDKHLSNAMGIAEGRWRNTVGKGLSLWDASVE